MVGKTVSSVKPLTSYVISYSYDLYVRSSKYNRTNSSIIVGSNGYNRSLSKKSSNGRFN